MPEILPNSKLSWGNGVLELGAFVGVIVGTIAAGVMADRFGQQQEWSGVVLLALAVVGLVCSLAITRFLQRLRKSASLRIRWRIFAIKLESFKGPRAQELAVLGNTWFWALATLLTANIAFYGEDLLHLSGEQGVAAGRDRPGHWTGKRRGRLPLGEQVEYGLIPLGTIGLSLFGILLALPGLSFRMVFALLSLLGFFARFFAVPINALISIVRMTRTKAE